MKKILFSLHLLVALFISACSKDEVPEPDNSALRPASHSIQDNLPTQFTQKVLMEMYTTAYCATCPDAMQKHINYRNQNPGRVIGVAIHDGDAMNSPQFALLDAQWNINQYSSGSFNRLAWNGSPVIHKTDWSGSGILNTCLNQTADCGLSIYSQILGNSARIQVSAGFINPVQGDIRLTLYLVEDSVSGSSSGYHQSNYYNNTASSPFYQLGNPIVGYQHRYVLRQVLSTGLGDVIHSNMFIDAGSLISRSYFVNLQNYNASRLRLVAFINSVTSSAAGHEILNVQEVKLGQSKSWD